MAIAKKNEANWNTLLWIYILIQLEIFVHLKIIAMANISDRMRSLIIMYCYECVVCLFFSSSTHFSENKLKKYIHIKSAPKPFVLRTSALISFQLFFVFSLIFALPRFCYSCVYDVRANMFNKLFIPIFVFHFFIFFSLT